MLICKSSNHFPSPNQVFLKCETHACYKKSGGCRRIRAGSGSWPCGPGRGTLRSGRTPGTGKPPGSCPGGTPRHLGIRHAGNILSGPRLRVEGGGRRCEKFIFTLGGGKWKDKVLRTICSD